MTGGSRNGKTTLVSRLTASDARLIVWDYPGRDWPETCERVIGMSALCNRLLEVGEGPARISYQGELDSKHFGKWASLALAWCQYAPVTVVAEELADVVHPGKAVRGWGELVRGGLAYETTIVGITQRPQETDKSIFGNATDLRIFGIEDSDDAKYIARKTRLPADVIDGLKPLEYIEKKKASTEFEVKKLSF